MSAACQTEVQNYQLAFIINTAVGALFLLLSCVAFVLEQKYPALRGGLIWGALFSAVLNLFLGSLWFTRWQTLKLQPKHP